MRNKVTKLSKLLSVSLIAIISLFISQQANAQNKACDASFEVKTEGYTISIKATGDLTNATLRWNLGDGNSSSLPAFRHTYTKNGVFSICLIVYKKDPNNRLRHCADTVCKRVEIKKPCRLEVDFDYRNKGIWVAFENKTKSNQNDLVYKWEFGDNNTSNRPNPAFNFSKAGIYKVCLTVASRDGKCRETVCKRVIVKFDSCSRLQAAFQHKVEDSKALFAATTQGKNLVYKWTVNGREVSLQQAFRHTFKKEGRYNVCLIVKARGTDCISRVCEVIEIEKPDPCQLLRVNYTYRQKGTAAAFYSHVNSKKVHYQWTVNGRKVSEKENFRINLKKEGRYNVCLIIKVRGEKCVKRVCKVVVVKRPEPCRIEASFKYRVHGHKVALLNTSKGHNLKYQWSIDGKPVSNREHYTTQLPIGKHRVCLTIGNGACRKTYCEVIEIKRPRHLAHNNGGSHNLTTENETVDEANNTTPEVTAHNDVPKVEMSIFPNPAQDVLNLKVEGISQATVLISNFSGMVFYQSQTISINTYENISIPVSQLPQGYYIAKVISADGSTTAELKFFKQ